MYEDATFYQRVFFEVEEVIQNLEEYEAEFVIKTEPNGKTLKTLTTKPNGGITLGGDKGTIDLYILAEETKTLATEWPASVYHQLFVINIGLEPPRRDVILRGGIKVVTF